MTYDSEPGAADWNGSSRCSCPLCILANRQDLVLAVRRRPRLTALYAEVERVRGHQFRADLSIAQLLKLAQRPGGPAPGVILAEDGPAFNALEGAVRAALAQPARRSLLSDPTESQQLALLSMGDCGSCGP